MRRNYPDAVTDVETLPCSVRSGDLDGPGPHELTNTDGGKGPVVCRFCSAAWADLDARARALRDRKRPRG